MAIRFAGEVSRPAGPFLALVEQLRKHGFIETESSSDARSFGNAMRVFERDPIKVRIVRDRGDWWAEMTAAGWPVDRHFGEEWMLLPSLLHRSE